LDNFLTSLTVDSRQKPLVAFDRPPPVGFVLNIKWFRRAETQTLTLEHAERHVRRYDGADSFVLTWRDARGVVYTSGLRGGMQKRHPPLIDFTEPPAIGHRLALNREGQPLARALTLTKVEPYTRRTDGVASFVLTWADDNGALYRSGMHGPYPRLLDDHELD
jgi:hypothetical protein